MTISHRTLLLIFSLFSAITIKAQVSCKWANKISGQASFDDGYAIAADSNGYVYVTGRFTSTTDFDPGPGIANLVGSTGAYSSLFLAKYDSLGNYIWAKKIGTNGAGIDLKLDISGNILLYGRFEGTVDFDLGPGVANLSVSDLTDGGFIAKYDPNGNYIWAKNIYSTYSTGGIPTRFSTDEDGSIYITGTFRDTKDFDPGPGTAFLTASTANNLASETFFAKYDSAGNYLWAKTIEGRSSALSITFDHSHNVFITGSFYNTVDFDPNAGISNLSSVPGSQSYYWDIFFAKYDPNGNYLWAHSLGSSNMDSGNDIKTDSSGNVYITGSFTETIDFDPNPTASSFLASTITTEANTYFAKYNSNGEYIWAKALTSNSSSNGTSILLDPSGYIYLSGTYYYGPVDFDPGAGTQTLSGLRYQMYFAKYDSSGNYIWAQSYGNLHDEYSHCMSLDPSGNIYITGEFAGTVSFGIPVQLTSYNNSPDGYLVKYKQTTPPAAGAITGPASVCAGQTGAVFSVPAIPTATGYSWSLPAGAMITNGSNTRTITVSFSDSATSGTITVQGTNSVGSGASSSFSLTVIPKPTINLSYSDTTICRGTSANLSANGANTYNWLPATFLNNTTIANPISTPGSSITYTVTGTLNGCSDTASVSITIPSIIISGIVSICQGSSTTLTATGIDSVIWSNGSNFSTITVSPLYDTTYYVTGSTLSGCTDSASQLITVKPNNVTNISATICNGSAYNFDTQILTSAGVYNNSYTAANGCDSTIILTLNVNPSYLVNNTQTICNGDSYSINGNVYTATGSYSDTIATASGCDSIVITQLTLITVDTTVTVSGSDLTANNSSSSYQWIDCNSNLALSGESGQTYTTLADGSFAVQITQTGCVDTSDCYNVYITSVKDEMNSLEIMIYPNPCDNQTTINFSEEQKDTEIKFTDVLGREMKTINFTGSQLTITTEDMKAGMYFLEIHTSNQIILKKVLIN
ncbi:MAG: hypothetical protein K0S44_812 [Bacteroidetes bacterium]|jgi:hypothetical protein|nr:hypothetical protein [Bacteroidota bacterium]